MDNGNFFFKKIDFLIQILDTSHTSFYSIANLVNLGIKVHFTPKTSPAIIPVE